MKRYMVHGDILYCETAQELKVLENGYLLIENGIVCASFDTLPENLSLIPLIDYQGKLIIPGMYDLHIHAAQYAYRGLYMDEELMDWLKKHAFPEEAKFCDVIYARKAYHMLAEQMRKSVTVRSCMFSSAHTAATEILMDEMDATGLYSFIGRVNMDTAAPDNLREPNAATALRETEEWICTTQKKYARTKPMLTPRFVPSCSSELLSGLGNLASKYQIPIQSHLSENYDEIELVRSLYPDSPYYGEVYKRFGLLGNTTPTVMAHCIYSCPGEIDDLYRNNVFVAHCPASNTNVIAGIAPIRRYLQKGLHIGLGSDIAGGHTESLFRAVTDAIQASKLYWKYVDSNCAPLTFPEAFFLATKGGGAFWGNAGSFEPGYAFDAVILDDSILPHPQYISPAERLERAIYLGLDIRGGIVGKFVAGTRIAL